MLAISPLSTNNDGGNNNNHHKVGDPTIETFSIGGDDDDFPDFSSGNLLDSIDFDDLFMGMHEEGGVLPDLEMDPEILAEFSLSGGEESEANNSSIENLNPNEDFKEVLNGGVLLEKEDKKIEEKNNKGSTKKVPKKEEIGSKRKQGQEREHEIVDPESDSTTTVNSSFKESDKGKKCCSKNNKSGRNNNNGCSNNQGKRKTKVDWTPELHRRFVQAVEQLGVDKAVPSRILELMGIDCLTRHNIASHLQKYRSHRKHLLAREAEAASWTQKRQLYGMGMGGGKGWCANNINPTPWHHPIMGFPPMTTPFRPLHVWGHPTPTTMDLHSRYPMPIPIPTPMWPKQGVVHPTASSPHPPPPADPTFWHLVPNAMTPGGVCFPQPLQATRFSGAAVPVPGIPSHAMYRPPDHGGVAPPPRGCDAHPSKESIDAAIGDVLAKPWKPLPIGLKPPSVDSVLNELQRQGVPKIPPSSSSSSP